MEELKNYLIKRNINYFVFMFFTFIFIICIWNLKNDGGIFPNLLENKYVQDITMNINYNRLLAKHELKQELKYTGRGEKLSESDINKSKKYIDQNVSKFSQLKGIKANNFDTYMKHYKHKYANKKGLSKLDCYCEKKLLDRIHHIYEFAETMKSDKKRLKRTFYKKYGRNLIFLSLIPALGFIFPILFGDNNIGRGIIPYCLSENHENKGDSSTCNATYGWHEHKAKIEIIGYFSYIFFFIIGVIVSLVFIYILIKVIKYKRLKAGRGKMNRKEYIDFCINLLKNE